MTLRAVLLATLALALWRSVRATSATPATRATTVRELPAVLRDVSRDARIGALDVQVDSMPTAREREWLAAIRRAGVAVRWHGTPPALAIEVQRSAEPQSRVRLLIAADSGAPLVIGDSAGTLDSLRVVSRGGTIESPVVVGRATVTRGRWQAGAAVFPASAPRAVLLLGRAGWEGKFVAAALQETGWTVRARLPTAPGVAVTDAALFPIDTSRYAAIVALDSTAADLAPAIARFVGQGGGLVLAGAAPRIAALRALSPAITLARRPARILLDGDSVTRADLSVRPLGAIRDDAVRLESIASEPTVMARRAGLGRVLAMSYDETWRWRMLGGTSGLAAHRDWWSRNVGLVAPEMAPAFIQSDAAPLASLIHLLGPSMPTGPALVSNETTLPLLLLVAIVLLLLAETASRRFRGAR